VAQTLALASGTAAEWVTAWGTVLLGLVAGAWTLFNFRRNRRVEAARWVREIFHDFYLDDRFDEIKRALEYDYGRTLKPLLERRLTNPENRVSSSDVDLLGQLDMFLNYFEHLLYLEGEGHFAQRDQQAVFRYWFALMAAPQRAALWRYTDAFEFRRVTVAIAAASEGLAGSD
jgi:hypothetical protein